MKIMNINKIKTVNDCDVGNVMNKCLSLESESYGIVSLSI